MEPTQDEILGDVAYAVLAGHGILKDEEESTIPAQAAKKGVKCGFCETGMQPETAICPNCAKLAFAVHQEALERMVKLISNPED